MAKNASGISGSIVALPLRSARINRPSDVEDRFIITQDYFPFQGPVVLVVKRVALSPSSAFLLKST